MIERIISWLKATFWPVGEFKRLDQKLSRVEDGMKRMAKKL